MVDFEKVETMGRVNSRKESGVGWELTTPNKKSVYLILAVIKVIVDTQNNDFQNSYQKCQTKVIVLLLTQQLDQSIDWWPFSCQETILGISHAVRILNGKRRWDFFSWYLEF